MEPFSAQSQSARIGSQRKTPFAVTQNVRWLLKRHGLEPIGFLALTFKRHVSSYKEAQPALHRLMTDVHRPRYPEIRTIMERRHSKRIRYLLLVAMTEDRGVRLPLQPLLAQQMTP